jgi:WD40 repeat protein
VRVWDLTTGQEALTLGESFPYCQAVAFSPDGKQLVAASAKKPVVVWDAATGRALCRHPAEMSLVYKVAFAPDGKGVTLLSSDAGRVDGQWRWSVSRRDVSEEQGTVLIDSGTTRPAKVAVSPDGRRLAGWSTPGELKVWTLGEKSDPLTIPLRTTLHHYCLVFSPDGRRLAGTTGGFVSGKSSGEITLWDANTGEELRHLRAHTAVIPDIAFSPDGSRLASASYDMTVALWDLTTGQELRRFQGHTEGVLRVAFSPDGKRLVSGGSDVLKIWEIATGREVLTLRGHTHNIHHVLFSPDGSRLVSVSTEGTIKIWDGSPWDGKPDPITIVEGNKDRPPPPGQRPARQ